MASNVAMCLAFITVGIVEKMLEKSSIMSLFMVIFVFLLMPQK